MPVRKEPMNEDPFISWLNENLGKPGKSQSGLARFLGIDPAAVNKIANGKRGFKSNEIAGAAEYFGVPAPGAPEVVAQPGLVPARLAGEVAAGMFQEVDGFDQSEPVDIYVPADERFPNARLLAFDVARDGDSMNDLKPRPILPGDRIIGVAFEDVADQVKLRDGMVVVVERTKDGGHMREWSVKQVEYHVDRVEFHPRSTNTKHKKIVVPHDHAADDGTTVEVIALVRSILSQLPF